MIALGISFFVYGYIIGSRKKYVSLGNTMGISVAIMLLLDPGVSSSFHVIFDPFLNVTFGIAVGVFITTYLWPKAQSAGV